LKKIFVLIDADVGIGDLDEDCIKTLSFTNIEFNVI
jgi:hypothetical protein